MRRDQSFPAGTGIAVLLFLSLLFTQSIFAQTATAPSGDGSSGDPYQIATLDNLYWITQNSSEWSSYFIQTADIDASSSSGWDSGSGFSPIGNGSTNFTGSYDGQSYSITGLTINRSGTSNIGFFGVTDGATLTNIALEDVDITGKGSVGAFIGEAYGASTITYNYVTGSITGDVNIGGIVGNFEPGSSSDIASAVFSQNYSTASISGNGYVGGIAGLNFGNISNCYATGSVTATGSGSNRYAGGIAGQSDEDITNCYASGAVSGNDAGGFVGINSGTVSGGYWNTETSGQSNAFDTDNNSQTVTGLTSFEMRNESQFSGWDFSTIWDIEELLSFPYLQNLVPDPLPGYDDKATIPAGDGTVVSPYLISTLSELYWLSINTAVWDSTFQQTADIDVSEASSYNSGSGLSPIGSSSLPFSGSYDGDGFTIINLTISRSSEDVVGLFGKIEDATLTDIGLVSAAITGQDSVGALAGIVLGNSTITGSYSIGSVSGSDVVGGLIGELDHTGSFLNNYSSATVTGTDFDIGGLVGESSGNISNSYATGNVSGASNVGGLIGEVSNDSVSTSYATGTISATNSSSGGLIGISYGYTEYSYATGDVSSTGNGYVGGLVGEIYEGEVNESFATGNVTSTDERTGGLVGYSEGSISNSYASGNVTGTTEVGGLLGENTDIASISNSYAFGYVTGTSNVGAFLGKNDGTITGGYWNPESGGQPVGIGTDNNSQTVTGLLIPNMKMESSFSGWDFTNTWTIDEDNSYPYLQNVIPDSIPGEGVESIAPSGEGSELSPYLISSMSDLYWVSITPSVWTSYFQQTANIDASETSGYNSGSGFSPIGSSSIPFGGTYDGDEYTISSLTINRSSQDLVGLFGKVEDATLTDIGLVSATITGQDSVGALAGTVSGNSIITGNYSTGSISGDDLIGGLIGSLTSADNFSNNYSSAIVTGDNDIGGLIGESWTKIAGSYATGNVTGESSVGGLVGDVESDTVSNSYATGNVSATSSSAGGLIGISYGYTEYSYATGDVSSTGNGYVGGLVGEIYEGEVNESFATGNVTSTDERTGGLVGYSEGSISNSYASGNVTGTTEVGGLLGNNTDISSVSNSYAFGLVNGTSNVGAFLGLNDGLISGGYWNDEINGQGSGIGTDNNSQTVTGLSVTEMRAETNFSAFDFTNTWSIDEGNSFPYLQNVVPAVLPGTGTLSTTPSGEGTTASPYLISSLAELYWLSTNSSVWDSTFQQTADIDASETVSLNDSLGFSPIGNLSDPFQGFYDGNGYSITGLSINRDTTDNVGLFGYLVGSGTILNVNLESITITGNDFVGGLIGQNTASVDSLSGNSISGSVTGRNQVGGLIGSNVGGTQILNNSSSAIVNASGDQAGGLIGENHNAGISDSYATGDVTGVNDVGGLIGEFTDAVSLSYATGNVTGSGDNVGGLIGYYSGSSLNNVFATGNVTGSGTYTGGLLGYGATSPISNCYATGDVTGDDYVGGLAGASYNNISNCYSTGAVSGNTNVGGFLGANSSTITGAYWNTETSGQATAIAENDNSQTVTGRTSAEMKQDSSFSEFDFDDIWGIYNGISDPYLLASAPDSLAGFPISFFPSGNGSESDPYLISDLDNLYWLSQVEEAWLSNTYFQQTTDIDASETSTWDDGDGGDAEGFSPIGNSGDNFRGSFDGDGFTISSLNINRSGSNNIGLFGYTSNATLADIGLENVSVLGNNYVGGLVGNANSTAITGSFTTGKIVGGGNQIGGLGGGSLNGSTLSNNHSTAEVYSDGNYVGGLFGLLIGSLYNSYATGDVTGISHVGGLAGLVNGSGTMSGNYATGNVTASSTSAGGLIGSHSYVDIENCFATGSVTGNSRVGGLIGFTEGTEVSNCFSTGKTEATSDAGGLIGLNGDATFTNSYWNTSTSGNSTGIGIDNYSQIVTGLTTAQMIDSTNFSGWDFASDTVWAIDNGFSFPYLPNTGDLRMVVAQIDSGEGWRMIGNPGDVTYGELFDPIWTQGFEGADSESGGSNVYFYEESTQGWLSPTTSSDYFGSADSSTENTALNGVLLYVYADDDATGPDEESWPKYLIAENSKINESFDVSLDYSDELSADSAGWNLVSNPYPVSLDWTEVVTNGDISNTFPVAYIWDDSLNAGNGAYRINYGYPLPPGLPQDQIFDGPIPAMQAFWVKATASGASLGFKPAYQSTSQVLYKSRPEKAMPEVPWLSLVIKTENFSDKVLLFGHNEDSLNYDVPKLRTIASRYVELGIKGESMDWASLTLGTENQQLPLSFSSTEKGSFTLSWESDNSFLDQYEVTFLDKESGTSYTLQSGESYTFNVTKETVPQLSLQISFQNIVSYEPGSDLPKVVALDQNYPNPFNPSTVIGYQLPERSKVELVVFDMLGRKVATLVNGQIEAGIHQVTFNARNLASGVYLYRLKTGDKVFTKKFTLIK